MGTALKDVLGGTVAVLEGIAEVPARQAGTGAVQTGWTVRASVWVHVDSVTVL